MSYESNPREMAPSPAESGAENTSIRSVREKTRQLLMKSLEEDSEKKVDGLMAKNDHLFSERVKKHELAIANANIEKLDEIEKELAEDIVTDILSNPEEKDLQETT